MNNNLSVISDILANKFGVAKDLVVQDANLKEDLNLSGIEVIDLLELISNKFNLHSHEDIDYNSFKSIDNILNWIEQFSNEM